MVEPGSDIWLCTSIVLYGKSSCAQGSEGGGRGGGERETETETEREGNRKNSWFSFREVAKISELKRFIIYLDHLVEGGPEKCCQL